ncbi:MAG: sulfatase [Armatimonadetes bacterium]|nr:sulfatase [Armatimonadota bacterium]NCO91130.1 sulfatase [Armatimonadota bacterium]NCP29384.1 sulfatase [Armatimonadota bacterium]NCQ26160.1 sulfatase [Armatimonadota bacterium]NDK13012.1 sulfatase [Armatimonadota bacterium]
MVPNEPNRREFLRRCGVAGGAAALCQPPGRGAAADGSRLPNIVMLISDDQGWGDYGFMGHPTIETPNLDRLASQSVTFTRGYVAAPLCCPSLASMITGLHPHQHKITSNDPPYTGDPKERWTKPWTPERRRLRDEMMAHMDTAPALPRLLAQRGYVSLQTGKWWYGNFRSGGFTEGMTHGDMARGGRHGDEGLKIGRQTMQPIWDFLDRTGDKPFFVWYAPMLPHQPHNPPERLLSKYKDKTESVHLARYWAMCEWWDETCGQLLDRLDEKVLSDDTLVLYVCDNGWIQRPNADGFAPRSKQSWYEGGIRTPLMVRWPGHTHPRRDATTLASSVDLAPTILAACGLKAAPEMQGIDLLDAAALARREAVFGASYSHDAADVNDPAKNLSSRWVVKGWWKLILPEPNQPGGKEPELYELKADPDEKDNLAAGQPDKVQELRALLDQWYKPA